MAYSDFNEHDEHYQEFMDSYVQELSMLEQQNTHVSDEPLLDFYSFEECISGFRVKDDPILYTNGVVITYPDDLPHIFDDIPRQTLALVSQIEIETQHTFALLGALPSELD